MDLYSTRYAALHSRHIGSLLFDPLSLSPSIDMPMCPYRHGYNQSDALEIRGSLIRQKTKLSRSAKPFDKLVNPSRLYFRVEFLYLPDTSALRQFRNVLVSSWMASTENNVLFASGVDALLLAEPGENIRFASRLERGFRIIFRLYFSRWTGVCVFFTRYCNRSARNFASI